MYLLFFTVFEARTVGAFTSSMSSPNNVSSDESESIAEYHFRSVDFKFTGWERN